VKPPKVLTRLLAVVLIGVWGAVGYQVYTSAFRAPPESAAATGPAISSPDEAYVYKRDVEDPFRSLAPQITREKKGLPPVPWVPPPLKVTGILSGNGKMTAILESPSGEISFLAEGDTTGGVKIVKIRSGLVVYTYRSQRKEWTVDGRE